MKTWVFLLIVLKLVGGAVAADVLALPEELREVAFSEKYGMSDRWKALTLLTFVQKERAIPVLEKALKSKEWFMRNAGLVGMQHVSEMEAKKSARKLLKDKALVVRSAAVDILAKDCGSADRGLLWEQMGDKLNFRKGQSLWIRPQIIKALSEGALNQELSLFLKYVKDDDLQIQKDSTVALERITKRKLSREEWLLYKSE